MRGCYNKFKNLVKGYGLRFLFCPLGLLLIAGIVTDTYSEEDSQAIELQKMIDEWYPQALKKYPRLQVQYKDVPDDQNGFLKIIEWEEEFEDERDWDGMPSGLEELLETEERNGSALQEKLREVEAYLKTKQVMLDRAMGIGLMPEQSVKGIPDKRSVIVSIESIEFARYIFDHLRLKAALEVGGV